MISDFLAESRTSMRSDALARVRVQCSEDIKRLCERCMQDRRVIIDPSTTVYQVYEHLLTGVQVVLYLQDSLHLTRSHVAAVGIDVSGGDRSKSRPLLIHVVLMSCLFLNRLRGGCPVNNSKRLSGFGNRKRLICTSCVNCLMTNALCQRRQTRVQVKTRFVTFDPFGRAIIDPLMRPATWGWSASPRHRKTTAFNLLADMERSGTGIART